MFDENTYEGRAEIIPLPASDGGQSPLNRILASLRGAHRRYLLYYLREEDPCDLDEASRRIAAWEYECHPADVPSEIQDRIKSELYHIHIPKLDDLDVIKYDDQTGMIRHHDPPEGLDDFIDLAREEDELD